VRAAQYPGQAPRTSALPLGVATAADMTPEERELWAAFVIAQTGAQGNARSQPPAPATVLQDKTGFRAIRTLAGTTRIIPAAIAS